MKCDMKKLVLYIAIVSVFATLTSCTKMLETHPENGIGGSVMWSTGEQARLGMIGLYNPMRSAGSYHRNGVCDGYTQYAFVWGSGFDDCGCRYFVNNAATTGFGVFSRKWLDDYTGVQACNLAIEKLPQMNREELPEDQLKSYLGEAHFLRAMYYFDLLTYYSGHKDNDPGIPVYTKMPAMEESDVARSTPKEVRELMISDLKIAIDGLAFKPYEKGRASRAAALGMLGKVYLYADDYSNAAATFRQLISENNQSSSKFSLYSDYAKLFTLAGENNSEYMFVIDCIADNGYGSYIDILYSNRSANCSGTSTSIPTNFLAESYLMKDGTPYEWDPNLNWQDRDAVNAMFAQRDPRLEATIIRPYGLFTGKNSVVFEFRPVDGVKTPYPSLQSGANTAYHHYLWRKFCNTGNETTTRRHSPTDIPIMRWGDILLLTAEAINEAEGPKAEVYDLLDQIRKRAGMPNVDRAALSTKEALRTAIRNERVYELAGEGWMYPDWQRWYAHNDADFKYYVENQKVYSADHKYVLPLQQVSTRTFQKRNWRYAIPKTQMEVSTKLVQSEGWVD